MKNTMYVGSTRELIDFHIQKVKNLDKAIEIDILNELDPLIKEYKTTALNLAAINNDVYQYNEMKDYDKDDFAKAKETHKPLLTAFEKFFTVNNILRNKTDSIQSEMEIIYLQKLKADGNTLQYLVGMSLNVSKKMLTICQSKDYEKLDAAELENVNKEVRNIYDELNTFKTENNENFRANVHMTFYFSSFKAFVQSSNDLTKRVKDKKPFSRGEKMNLGNSGSGWMVNGSVPKLLKDYNNMIDNYNRMN